MYQQLTDLVPKKYPRIRRSIELGLVAHGLYQVGSGYVERYKERQADRILAAQFVVKIEERDELFDCTVKELFKIRKPEELKAVTAEYEYDGSVVGLYPQDDISFDFEVGGHTIVVKLDQGGYEESFKSAQSTTMTKKETAVSFVCPNVEARDAVIAWLKVIGKDLHTAVREPSRKILSASGGWRWVKEMQARTIDTVILPDDQIERIVSDLERFLNDKDRYDRLGIPWHRGYLFYGPPGTGKTSLAKALANRFELDLWYAPMSSFKSDSEILSNITEVGKGLLLLEDVDVFSETHVRDNSGSSHDDDEAVTLAGLLNGLDGVFTPPGLITVMTTNDLDAIDPALIRPGRIDMVEKIDYLTDEQATKLFRNFYGDPSLPAATVSPKTTAAQLVEIIKQNWDDPEAAIELASFL